ncbi:hypothetical protein EV217_3843 [Phyllobacterium myrsinacearum]|uniref:hypothetical protein n=1 Tax=Phyllobacterium myrsinacearum TaxID=28101 RepID=UPI0010298A93|nr:hypothetical protein [Phyllobacterium myrsinacearum]RZS79840.1 hypothetical protein EV217_3843 [Phyllobacterium myrsinacearum]
MATPTIPEVGPKQAGDSSDPKKQFDEALNQAILKGGGMFMSQQMMKIANEILGEAMDDE